MQPLITMLFTMGVLVWPVSWAPFDPLQEQHAEYENWIRPYRQTPLNVDSGAISPSPKDEDRALLNLTVIDGDDLPVDKQQIELWGGNTRTVFYGCSVSTQGRIAYFQHGFGGSKGSGYPVLAADDLNVLKGLLANLPDDHSYLPPPGRRMVIQAAISGHPVVRVYDRANLPDAVLAIIRVTNAHISPWALQFPPEKRGSLAEFLAAGIRVPMSQALSPDGSLMAAQGPYRILVSSTSKPVSTREIIDPEFNVSAPLFTADGRYLLVQSDRPALLIYDVKTWQKVNTLPGLPAGAVAYFPDTDWKLAVFASSKGEIGLWNVSTNRKMATLAAGGELLDASFSSDHDLVAIATRYHQVNHAWGFRVRIFRADDGRQISEFHPEDQIQLPVAPGFPEFGGILLWWPGGEYLMTIVHPLGFFTDHNIAIWSPQSGRYHGYLTGCPNSVEAFQISPDTGRLFARCNQGEILMWNAAVAVQQIRRFERSLIETPSKQLQ